MTKSKPKSSDDRFHFAFKMIPRRQGAGDGGVHEQYVEESATQPTPVALECKMELQGTDQP